MNSGYPPGPPPPPPPPPPPATPAAGAQRVAQQHAQHAQPIMYQQQAGQQQPLSLHPTNFSATYYGLHFTKIRDRDVLSGRAISWAFVNKHEMGFTQDDYREAIRSQRGNSRKSVWDVYAELRSDNMRKQIDEMLARKRYEEPNPYAEWSLAWINTKTRPVPGMRNATETESMTVIMKRSPKYPDGLTDGLGRNGVTEVVDVNRPVIRPPHLAASQQNQGYAAVLNPQGAFLQQAGQIMKPMGPPPPPQVQIVPQPIQMVKKPKVVQQGPPKHTKANGQPLYIEEDSDEGIVNIQVNGNKTKVYPKQYPKLPPPPIGSHSLGHKLSLKGLQDARRMSGGPEVLVVRDPKLERDVKNIRKALDRRNMTDSDSELSVFTDDSFSSDDFGTPPSSTDSNMQSRMHRRAHRRPTGNPWTGRKMTAERVHQKPPVRRYRSRSTSPRRRMSLSRRNTDSKMIELPPPIAYHRPESADYLGRPLAERRQTYHAPLDFPPRPRAGQRALTYDETDHLRSLTQPRPFLADADERDVLARDINILKEQEARDYIMSQDMRGERVRKELELRAIERRELDRRLSRGIVEEEMERLQVRDRLEQLQRLNNQDRLSDVRRLDEKLRNLDLDGLGRDRRNSYAGYGL